MSHRGHKHTAESRAKISATKLGHTVSPESREKMSVAKLGKHLSAETRAKLSVAHGHGEQNRGWRGGKDAGNTRRRAKNTAPELREQARFYRLQRLYGLSQEAFEAMLSGQGGRCAACGTSHWGSQHGTPNVDHDHDTGTIRGLLCSRCNQAAGLLDDNPVQVQMLFDYLKRTASTKEEKK